MKEKPPCNECGSRNTYVRCRGAVVCRKCGAVTQPQAQEERNYKDAPPLNEDQNLGVGVKLGKILYDTLGEWSRERFGRTNHGGMLRLLVHEEWLRRQKPAAPAPEAP
jgi:hypothetical protein